MSLDGASQRLPRIRRSIFSLIWRSVRWIETRDAYTYRLRQQHSVPLLESFRKWLDEQAPQILPESLLGKAISYTRNRWTYLSRYVSDGRAPIDNNVIERDIRPF